MDYNTSNKVLRVACYERVSTEEQARHGLSIDAQISALASWVSDHGHVLVGHFTDAGVSGGAPIEKRPEMARLLRMVERDQVDLILFTKLDRWFRSLKNYYKSQDILDRHKCAWQATQEDYETLTASGRFKVNIMLSVAENERERTSERIKAVFDYKRAQGDFLGKVPLGFKRENGKLLIDEKTAPIVRTFFSTVLSGRTIEDGRRAIIDQHGIDVCSETLQYMRFNPIYTNGFLSESEHNYLLQSKHTRSAKRTFVFSGLIRCPECGKRCVGNLTRHRGREYTYYRCKPCHITHREERIESALTAYLFRDAQIVVRTVRSTVTETKAPTEAQINAQLKRLAETYTDGLIDRDTYKQKLQDLTAKREALRNTPKMRSDTPLSLAREIINGDLLSRYDGMTAAQKQRFWRHVLRSVTVRDDQITAIDFIDPDFD